MVMPARSASRNRRYVLNVTLFSQLMRKYNWASSAECAKALNLHHSAVARLRAKQSTPTYRVAREMAEFFDVPHDLLWIPEEES